MDANYYFFSQKKIVEASRLYKIMCSGPFGLFGCRYQDFFLFKLMHSLESLPLHE